MKFQIDHDYHIHSRLSACSGDPEQTAESILAYAKRTGLQRICITDHFWDSEIPGASPWYSPQDFAHLSSILPLPEDSDVRFYFGCETEMDMNFNLAISKRRLSDFDFIIIPTSHLHNPDFTIPKEMTSPKERAKFYMQRNRALLEMDLPYNKIGIAHFTCSLIAYYSDGTICDVLENISNDEYYSFFKRVSALGMGVELNMSVSEAELDEVLRPYRIARECGCKFYLGSDAHTVKSLASAHAKFEAIVNALSLTEDEKFHFDSSYR